MTGLLLFSLVGLLAALARGGSLVAWSTVHVRWGALAMASLAVQLFLHNPPIDRQPWAIAFGPFVWLFCLTVLCLVLVRNAIAQPEARLAWSIAALGVTLNLLVVAANGGHMPQSADARGSTRGPTPVQSEPRLRNVVSMSDTTQLNVLGDVIAEPAWLPNANVISLGDLLLGLGLGLWTYSTTTRVQRRRPLALTA